MRIELVPHVWLEQEDTKWYLVDFTPGKPPIKIEAHDFARDLTAYGEQRCMLKDGKVMINVPGSKHYPPMRWGLEELLNNYSYTNDEFFETSDETREARARLDKIAEQARSLEAIRKENEELKAKISAYEKQGCRLFEAPQGESVLFARDCSHDLDLAARHKVLQSNHEQSLVILAQTTRRVKRLEKRVKELEIELDAEQERASKQ